MVREVLVPPLRAWPQVNRGDGREYGRDGLLPATRSGRMSAAQLFLLLLLSTALWGCCRVDGRMCGWSLGLAAVYKVTPAIFLPYLIWKRQWRPRRLHGRVERILLPAAGALSWLAEGRRVASEVVCFRHALSGRLKILRKTAYAKCACVLNQSLPLAVARMVQDYPEGHRFT